MKITPNGLQADQTHSYPVQLTPSYLAKAIERSWHRCLINGLDKHVAVAPVRMTAQELKARQEQNQLLIDHTEPEMATLSEQIAHTRSMVILTDKEGVILRSMGDQSFVSEAERVSLSPGTSWSETHRGTNAIGTALIEQSAITVQGSKHFLKHHHTLSCSAVPIFGAQNQLLATLDVSNDLEIPQQHTLALVKMAAQMVENRLFKASHQADIAVHFHSRAEFIGTLWEGIALFNEAGQLIATNRSGQFQLHLDASLTQLHFNQLFDHSLYHLKRNANTTKSLIFSTYLTNGARIYAQVDFLNHTKAPTTQNNNPQSILRTSAANLDLLDNGDPQVKLAITQVKQVIGKEIPILIQGETGVGKDLFARAIHDASPRATGPWVAVNCAALPEGLIEAELFGYEEGAFTGARKKGNIGKIAQANGGTLFLDEIGDMPLSLQARLLRVLQDRAVTPLGSTQSTDVNFALISATNQSLKTQVTNGAFRSDLYYRLNGLSVMLPALRNRSDLTAIIQVIMHIEQANDIEMSDEVMQIFADHPWPGNIRQLHNVLRTAIALADGQSIQRGHLTQDFMEELFNTKVENPQREKAISEKTLHNASETMIRQSMQQHAGNISATARSLGISRNTLYRKLKQFDLA